ncbi:MAG TPA: hypothetical protein VN699_06405 [Pirellulales bacterium]|nr:hypothetical protein [Pirellulales bacterium]
MSYKYLQALGGFMLILGWTMSSSGCAKPNAPSGAAAEDEAAADEHAGHDHDGHDHDGHDHEGHDHDGHDHADHDHANHDHGAWWCPEHGVPEDVCGQCNSKLAAEFQKDGDWCEEHEAPDSQCFACHPDLEAKFAALYEAKYGKQPPKLGE